MRHWKKIVAAVAVLAVAVVVAGVAVLKSLDFNEYRGLIAERVKAATGRELVISGELNLELSLDPAIAVAGVSFANAPWGSRTEMATVRRFAAEVALLPLLGGDVRVQRLVLEGLDLLAETDAKGRGNWELDGAKAKPGAAAPGAGGPAKLPVVRSVHVEDVTITYLDGRSGRRTVLALASLDVRADGAGSPMRVSAEGAFDGKAFTADGQLGALETLLAGGQPYAVDLNVAALGADITVTGAIAEPRAIAGLDLKVTAKGAELKETLAAVEGALPALKDMTLPAIGPFEVAATVKGGPGGLAVLGLKASVGRPGQLAVAIRGDVADALAVRGLDLGVALEGKDIGALAKAAGLALAQVPPFKLTGRLSEATGGYVLDRLDAKIGASDLRGRVSVRLAGVRRPTVDARLESSLLDLDALLPAGGGAAPKPARPRDRVFPADPLPLEVLKAADGRARLSVKRLVIGGIALDDVDVGAVLGAGRLDVKPAGWVIAGGKVRGDLVVDGSGPVPAVTVNLDARGVDYGALLEQLKLTDIASGKADAKVNLKGRGGSVRAVMADLDGRVRLVTEAGKVESGLLNVLSADVTAALPFVDSKGDKEIQCGVVDIDVRAGRAAAKALVFETGGLSMIGTGGINLADETVDIRVDPRAKKLSVLKLTMVPVNVGGTLASPTATPDVAATAVGAVTGAVRTATDIAKGGVKTLGGLVGLGGRDKREGAARLDETDYCELALAGRPLKRARSAPPPASKTGGAAPPPAAETAAPQAPSTTEKLDKKLEEVGKDLGGTLKGLFGK